MDGNGGHRRKAAQKTKQPLKKKKPLKVVYISNPMRVETSAAKFMALVQQLTGQHAEFPADPSNFYSAAAAEDANLTMNDSSSPSSLEAELPAEDEFLGGFCDDFDETSFFLLP